MKLLAERTYWVSTYDDSDGLRNMHQWTRTKIARLLANGVDVEAESDETRALPEFSMTKGHSKPEKPAKADRKVGTAQKTAAANKINGRTARVATRTGRGFTRAEQLRGAAAGGKARAATLTKKQRRESARKAVLARWAKAKSR